MSNLQLASVIGSLRETVACPSDGQLLHAFATCQDQAAFAQIVQRHGPLVMGVCQRVLQHRQDAEDAFQATFLVLARHPCSVRKREALASWLYGTSYRIAMKAKRAAARRHQHERQKKSSLAASPVGELAWREVQSALDEETQQLPGVYRTAFVLCSLQGVSLVDAAQQLGVKEGTVSSRLSRARRLLRQALSRRGISLSGLLAALAVAGDAQALVSRRLVNTTARTALEFRAGTVSGLSAKVVSLAEGVVHTMFTTKAKLVTILVLVCGLLGAGAFAWRPQGIAGENQSSDARPTAPVGADKPATEKQTAPKEEGRIHISGRVLDQGGKPVAGARVYLLDQSSGEQPPKIRVTSNAEGRFRFTVAKADVKLYRGYRNPWAGVVVVALANGYGPALSWLDQPNSKKERLLRLVRDDIPIKGRVLDLEGQPLAGVRIAVHHLAIPKKGDLSAFWNAVQVRKSANPPENTHLQAVRSAHLGHFFPSVLTDQKGRFTIKGIGRERLVGLQISGPGIETRKVRILTRKIKTLAVPLWEHNPRGTIFIYHGALFDHVAAPSSPIIGVVRDKDTGKPIPRALVYSHKLAGSNIHGNAELHTVADKKGRYRLTGMPRGEGNILLAHPPRDLRTITEPYVMVLKKVPKGDGHKPRKVDIEMKRGVWIRGKAMDRTTGKPVHGRVEYFASADNAHLADYPGFTSPRWVDNLAKDGSFQFVGLPGHGLLAFRARGDGYLIGAGADKVKAKRDRYFYRTRPYLCHADGYHAFVDLNPAVGTKRLNCAVLLDPGQKVTGTLLGPDGKPLAGALIRGLRSYSNNSYWEHKPQPTAKFTALGLAPDRPRRLLFVHKEKKLAGSLLLKGTEKGHLTVKLQSWGTLKGRVVQEDGLALGGVTLRFTSPRRAITLRGEQSLGSHPDREFRTNKDGTFLIEGLVPGLKYSLAFYQGNKRKMLIEDVVVKPGETKDVGDVRPQQR